MAPTPTLSTTSFAILGYLAIRPWSAYELAKQMGRTLHHFWARAESGIYREVKRLEEAGLATAREEAVGRRSRTEYAITFEGHAAVARWLAVPSSNGSLGSEGLVRVLLADGGTKDQLIQTLAAMRADADAQAEQTCDLIAGYSIGRGQFMERAHVNLLIGRFLVDFATLVDEWTAWATDVVQDWPDTAPRPPTPDMLDQCRALLERRSCHQVDR